MLDVKFYKLYNCLWARDLMPYFCRDFCDFHRSLPFLRATAATAVARLSHHNSVHLFVCLSVTRVDQSKTVQATITKSSPSAAWKTLVSGTVKFFHKFEVVHPERGR